MNLASAELVETAELKEICPLVDDALDTAEDYLHQDTENVPVRDNGGVGASAYGNSPDQTGSSGAQATGNAEARIAERSKVATTVATAECTSAHTVVYPNSSAANLTIIIENNNRAFPVMNSDTTEAPGGLERGNHGATVTTGVAGAEQKTRTGHQYTKLLGTHVEPVLKEVEETSWKGCSHLCQTVTPSATVRAHTCEGGGMPMDGWVTTVQEAQHPGLSEECLAGQASFTKMSAEEQVELEEEVKIEFPFSNPGNEWGADCYTRGADFSETLEDSDLVKFSSQFSAKELDQGDELTDCCMLEADFSRDIFADSLEVQPDVRTDHLTSTPVSCVIQPPCKDSRKEVLKEMILDPEESDVDNKEVQRTVNVKTDEKLEEIKETGSTNTNPVVNSSTAVLEVLGEIYDIMETASTDNDIKEGSNEIKEVQYENIRTASSESEFEDIVGNKFETGRRKEGCNSLGRETVPPRTKVHGRKTKRIFILAASPAKEPNRKEAETHHQSSKELRRHTTRGVLNGDR